MRYYGLRRHLPKLQIKRAWNVCRYTFTASALRWGIFGQNNQIIEELLCGGKLVELEYEGNRYYMRKLPSRREDEK
jgi:hypothetical protein